MGFSPWGMPSYPSHSSKSILDVTHQSSCPENKLKIRADFPPLQNRPSTVHVCHTFHHKLTTKNHPLAPTFPKPPSKNAHKTQKAPAKGRGSSHKKFRKFRR